MEAETGLVDVSGLLAIDAGPIYHGKNWLQTHPYP